jgi:hypothetical protein
MKFLFLLLNRQYYRRRVGHFLASYIHCGLYQLWKALDWSKPIAGAILHNGNDLLSPPQRSLEIPCTVKALRFVLLLCLGSVCLMLC